MNMPRRPLTLLSALGLLAMAAAGGCGSPAEVQNGRIQKFRPKPNADPAKLIGQEVRLATTSSN